MLKKIILKSIMAVLVLQGTSAIAKDNTPIEAFINRVKTNSTFVTVGNIWQADNNFDKTDMLKNVEKAQPLLIDYMQLSMFMKQKSTAINLVLPGTDGKTYTIELARYDFFSNEFEVHEMGANNSDKLVSYTPGLYYRGVVKGMPGSVAAFSFFNNEVYGIFSIPDEGNYVVAPNTMVGKDYDYNSNYVLYNDMDLKIKHLAPSCHTDELPEVNPNLAAAKTTTTLNNKVYYNCKEINTFETADFSMYQKKGSSTTNSTNFITAVFNNKSTLYKNEGVAIVLKYVQVNTAGGASDPYGSLPASSSAWLEAFGDVTMNTLHGCDLAILFTTKYGTMGGVAWIFAACTGYDASSSFGPYAFCNVNNSSTVSSTPFPTYSWDVEVATHEMGHSLGSPHTHRCCWNPPARNTAIDKCQALEGSCPNPSPLYPTGGGTIMSYCHLQSVGINFSKGFGQQPGDTVRFFIKSTSSFCGNVYRPNAALATANATVTANVECTDITSGITYYYDDKNTASHTDDVLALMVKKNGNNIGDMNSTGFLVKSVTLTGYGGGTAQNTTFPTGTSGVAPTGSNYAMRRYWNMIPVGATTLTTPVDVIFPFMPADTSDVNGSVPGTTAPMANYRMFKTKNPLDPNPANNFPLGIPADLSIYTYSGAPSTTKWSLLTSGSSTILADFKVSSLPGGGGGFYAYGVAGLGNINKSSGIEIFPNPTNNDWYISLVENNSENINFQLYSADGRLAHTQVLQGGTVNTVNAADLPAGMYFYRIISGSEVYTGNLMKN